MSTPAATFLTPQALVAGGIAGIVQIAELPQMGWVKQLAFSQFTPEMLVAICGLVNSYTGAVAPSSPPA